MSARTRPRMISIGGGSRSLPRPRVIPGSGARGVGLRRALSAYGWIFVASLIGLTLFFGVIYARVFLDKSAFEIADLQSRITQQQQLNQQLRLHVAELEAPGRVFDAASRLGLLHPELPPIVIEN